LHDDNFALNFKGKHNKLSKVHTMLQKKTGKVQETLSLVAFITLQWINCLQNNNN